eukprot:m.245055 g.245055  ORF g.245055 m.245055 type:complete len:514 (+) comp40252_c0_seq17:766-2307(+)
MKMRRFICALLFAFGVVEVMGRALAPRETQMKSVIKQLSDQKTALDVMVGAHMASGANPVGHVYGQYSGRYNSGSTLSEWHANSSNSRSILAGGMTLSNGGLVVPFSGNYYVYGQLQLDHQPGDSNWCGFEIRVGRAVASASYTYMRTNTGEDDHTKYTGMVRKLIKGDRVTIRMRNTCSLDNLHSGEAFLGAFFISFDYVTSGRPILSSYGSQSTTVVSGGNYTFGSYTGSNLYTGGAAWLGGSYFRAANTGLYFIFGQQQFDPQITGQNCGFRLKIGSMLYAWTSFETAHMNYDKRSEHTGRVAYISRGSDLRMYSYGANGGCLVKNHAPYGTFMGMFYLPFQDEAAIHLVGEYSGTKQKGYILDNWNAVEVLKGIVKYNKFGFTVPKSGVYYIYGQIHLDPISDSPISDSPIVKKLVAVSLSIDQEEGTTQSNKQMSMENCGYEIRSGSRVLAAGHHWQSSPNNRERTVYTASAVRLNAGDTVSVMMQGYCNLKHFGQKETFLGAFYLHL